MTYTFRAHQRRRGPARRGLLSRRQALGRPRLPEKGGTRHDMPVHHKLDHFLDEYLDAAGIRDAGKTPLFRSATGKTSHLTETPCTASTPIA